MVIFLAYQSPEIPTKSFEFMNLLEQILFIGATGLETLAGAIALFILLLPFVNISLKVKFRLEDEAQDE